MEMLSGIINILVDAFKPKIILLFGSRAKGKNSKNADFDIAVDTKIPDIRTERKIKEKIEKIAGLYRIDVVYLKSVNEEFREIILKSGKVIYEERT